MTIDYQATTYILGLGGAAFAIYSYFREPQVKSERIDAVMAVVIDQIQKDIVNLRDNHIHTLDTKLNETNKTVSTIAVEVARLSTVIEERIPRK
jgi:hypothetical protein